MAMAVLERTQAAAAVALALALALALTRASQPPPSPRASPLAPSLPSPLAPSLQTEKARDDSTLSPTAPPSRQSSRGRVSTDSPPKLPQADAVIDKKHELRAAIDEAESLVTAQVA